MSLYRPHGEERRKATRLEPWGRPSFETPRFARLLRMRRRKFRRADVKQPSVIARVLCQAPGPPVFHCEFPVASKAEGARNARVPMDPRTSTPRDIEACRSPVVPQVRRFPGVPRAVFLGLLRIAPGGLPVSGTLLR